MTLTFGASVAVDAPESGLLRFTFRFRHQGKWENVTITGWISGKNRISLFTLTMCSFVLFLKMSVFRCWFLQSRFQPSDGAITQTLAHYWTILKCKREYFRLINELRL